MERGDDLAMIHLARYTYGFLPLAAIFGLVACKPSSDVSNELGTGAGGEAGITEQTSNAGQAGQADQVAEAGASTMGGAASADITRGLILISQATKHSDALMLDTAHSSLSVMFATRAEAMREQAAAAVTTEGDCVATVVTVDPSAPRVTPPSGLNAGTITITGIGMPSTYVANYLDNGTKGPSNYSHADAATRFYQDGDVLSVRGTGGPDLPAFGAHTLAAPSDIAITAPACVTGTCPDVDHTQDLSVAWENGGAGKVDVLFETIADVKVVLLECKFDALAGKGVVPASLLAKLDVVDGENVSGIEQINPIDEKTFWVGDVSTTFSIRTAQFEALLQPAN